MVVDGRRNQDWNTAHRDAAKCWKVDIERRRGRARTIETSDCRRGHSHRRTKRHWRNAREGSELEGHVVHPLEIEDRHKEAAPELVERPIVGVVVVVENCKTVGLRQTFCDWPVIILTLEWFGSAVTKY